MSGWRRVEKKRVVKINFQIEKTKKKGRKNSDTVELETTIAKLIDT